MRRPIVYSPYGDARFLLLIIIVAFAIGVLILNLFTTAFVRIGFSWHEAIVLLLLSLGGSQINLPLYKVRTEVPVVELGLVRYGPFLYRVPLQWSEKYEMQVALNAGGGLIPIVISVYLLARYPHAIPLAGGTTLILLLVVNRLARPVEGVGIVIMGLWPPVVTAISVLLLSRLLGTPSDLRFAAAYVGGCLGTLIGADLLNLRAMSRLGTGIGSIGGAGTFDGIFLTGIVAVLLT